MVSNRWFRKHQKKIFVVLGVIIMITWYMASAVERLLSPRAEAGGRLFGEHISGDEVLRVKQGLFALSPEFYQKREAKRLTADAWQHLIELVEADRLGVVVSEEETREVFRSLFRGRNGFDTARYHAHLTRAGSRPSDFERILRERLRIGKMQEIVARSVKLTDEETWQWYRYFNERVRVRYAQLRAETLADLVEVDEDALKAFHEQRMAMFPKDAPFGHGYRVPEKVRIEYLLVPDENYRDAVVVTERQVEKYYRDHKYRYLLPEANAAPARDDADDAATAPAPRYRPLAEVRGEILKALRQAAMREMASALMDRVNDEIGKRMETAFGSREKKSVEFKEVAKDFPVRYGITDFFDADHLPDELAGAKAVREEAFGGGPDSLRLPRGPFDSPSGPLMFQVIGLQPERASAYEEVADRVARDYRLERARALAERLLREATQSGGDFQAALAYLDEKIRARKASVAKPAASSAPDTPEKTSQKGGPEFLAVGETGFLKRPRRVAEDLVAPGAGQQGRDLLLAEEAFRLAPGDVGVAVAKDRLDENYLLTVLERRQATRAEFDRERKTRAGDIAYLRTMLVLRAMQRDLVRRANPSDRVKKLLEWRRRAVKG